MQTSARGIDFLERHEGVVLRAYRCPAGVWTIGAGLTAASGVVTPRAGMVITAQEARRLLELALPAYEAAVARAMPGAAQHEFDAGVNFHFNTGAIGRAAWVRAWRDRDWPAVERLLTGNWVTAAGRVLPGLQRRRREEFALLRRGEYGAPQPAPVQVGMARIVADLTPEALQEVRAGLRDLGFDPGGDLRGLSAVSVRKFQAQHGLTVDGIVGPATLATLQREMDARRAALVAPVAGLAAAAADLAAGQIVGVSGGGWLGLAVLGVAVGLIAWRYRDVLAARLHRAAPQIAGWLRSF